MTHLPGQVRGGLQVPRTGQLSTRGRSMFQRCSSGSRPVNTELYSLSVPVVTPAVATPTVTRVESSQWCEIAGGSGAGPCPIVAAFDGA